MASCISPSSIACAREEFISLHFFFTSAKLMDSLFFIVRTNSAEILVVPSSRSTSFNSENCTSNAVHSDDIKIPLASTCSNTDFADLLSPLDSSSSSFDTPIEKTNSPLSWASEFTDRGCFFGSSNVDALLKASFIEPTNRFLSASFIVLSVVFKDRLSPILVEFSAPALGSASVSGFVSSTKMSPFLFTKDLRSLGQTFHLRVEFTKNSQNNPCSASDNLLTLGP
mmetsp:Transcript_10565/g.25031  ORF Transcript_10565/g.25031 Transcript_10565/m.25031 type:complete len:226 (+) Transcript_10565:1239-1916(+)